MNDWMPRFVFPCEIIPPSRIISIHVGAGTLAYTHADGRAGYLVRSLSDARADRPTGLTDRSGKMIFERDRVADEWGAVWTVCMDDGAWCVCDGNDGQCEILDTIGASIVTITGFVPYEEDSDADS